MILSRRVALNGVQLDSVDERIIIQGIDEAAGKEGISAVSFGGRSGQRVTNRRRDTLDITVRFGINIRRTDMAGREAVLEAVNSWAASGGTLTLSHKPGRRLAVVLAQAPGMGNAWEWTNEFSLVFRSYAIPFWEDVTETSAESTGTSASISVPGNVETQANVTVENTSSGTINAMTITMVTGGKSKAMAFSSLGLAAGEKLVIDHNTSGLLRIRIQSTGGTYRTVLAARSDESVDDFIVTPGTAQCQLTISGARKLTVSTRGRWL